MLQNAEVTVFIIYELLRENKYGGGVKNPHHVKIKSK